ncbi:WxL protein peptidoglycan domain-containing protein [Oerskovia sp. NPDC056781]|uniref:WxL protein peptidoglycan domain-containing protein n=1 Tax=Oerskovia sp. NPDC056781 TaxID=3345942 RepID=UPI00366F46B8
MVSKDMKKAREAGPRPTRRTVARLRTGLAALGALAFTLVGVVGAAHASAPDPDSFRFSVTTASSEGPDDRRIFDFVAEPGAQIQDQVAVSNHGPAPVTFAMVTNDGIFTPTGSFDIRTSDQEPQDSGGWFEVQPSVEVPAGETVIVPFTITVPENVTPGDHPAGIVATVTTAASASGPGVGVESRVGVRVNLRVPGEVVPSIALDGVTATYTPSWNPFAPGDVRVSYEVTNDGNLRVAGDQTITASGPFGIGASTLDRGVEGIKELIPGTSRSTAATIGGIWPVGPVTTEVVVTPALVATEGEAGGAIDVPAADLRPVTVTVTTWAIPWVHLLLLAVVALVVIGVRDNRRRRTQRLDALLAKARAEGRAAAAAEPGPEPGADAVSAPGDPAPSAPDALAEPAQGTRAPSSGG